MKKHFYFLYISFCVLVLLLTGCVASSVGEQSNAIATPEANLTGYKTYAWYQPERIANAAYNKGFNAELDDNLRQAIEEELKQKGMHKVSLKPDVMLAYDISVSVPAEMDRPDLYADGFGYGFAYMSGYRYNYKNTNLLGYRSVDLYKQGTLIIDLIDPANNQLLWRGWTEGAIVSFKASYKKVHEQVENILNTLKL